MTYICTHAGCKAEFDSERARKIHISKGHSSNKPWTDADRLEHLYHEEGLSAVDIAEGEDITPSGVRHWMDKHGIERRTHTNDKHVETPWQDKNTLKTEHHEKEKTTSEIAEEMGCAESTIKTWLRRHGIENRSREIKRSRSLSAEPKELRRLYHDEGLSLQGVADEIGVSRGKVRSDMQFADIPRRTRLDVIRANCASFGMDMSGYECWRGATNDRYEFLRVHRLLAIACGESPHKVFSGNYHVHHKNGLKWGNWHSNIELLSPAEHRSKHPSIDEKTRERIADEYDQGTSGYELAKRFDVARRTVSKIHSEHYDERSISPKRASE
ncbi:hypothetical protein NDI85_21305 [Halomicroarcula sp. S1AR25-4]|uniref:hypothetical protein n=1 Tax=Haloarcula sp. S1AR25-4 TaxID=2950538 RepID=UPI00287431AF|nr:hypothetical protein [Halomicroarcula sp. S1AR25-4]MDS0280326.1 hypothetical protein [Halomicroarcula sp. S1AR25-4]